MSEQKWVLEPWPIHSDARKPIKLHLIEYNRAASCVNACAGMPDPAIRIGALMQYETDASRKIAELNAESDALSERVRVLTEALSNVSVATTVDMAQRLATRALSTQPEPQP